MSINFVAIDFELANASYDSVCAVGLATVNDGEIISTDYKMIKPPTEYFTHTRLHGITFEMVKDSQTFEEIWPWLIGKLEGNDIVAHNATTEMHCISTCADRFNLSGNTTLQFFDTYRYAKQFLPLLKSYKLCHLADFFDIKMNHHHALDDAITCAKIAVKMLKFTDPVFLGNEKAVESRKGESHKNKRDQRNSVAYQSNFEPIQSDLEKDVPQDDGRFVDANFVLTGALATLTREKSEQIIAYFGGKIGNTVTKKTTHIVIAYPLHNEQKSGKHKKALECIENGQEILIWDEQMFREAIFSKQEN